MEPSIVVALVLVVGFTAIGSARAHRGRRPGDWMRQRGPSAVARGWPIRRPLVPVLVRPSRIAARVAPLSFLPPIEWGEVVVAPPPPGRVTAWQGDQFISPEDGWMELMLNCNQTASTLLLDVGGGPVQADWAEIVLANGDTQVVDFDQATLRPGLHSLLTFSRARRVDHVRIVAQATRNSARTGIQLAS